MSHFTGNNQVSVEYCNKNNFCNVYKLYYKTGNAWLIIDFSFKL